MRMLIDTITGKSMEKAVDKDVDKEWYDLSDLEDVRTWNYTSPTLVREGRTTNRQPWTESSSFWTEFTKRYPLFQHVNIEGLAIYGGAVQDLLIGQYPNDIDMCFCHEGTPLESGIALKNRVERFLNDIYDFIIKNNKLKEEEHAKNLANNESGVQAGGHLFGGGGLFGGGRHHLQQYNVSDILVTRFKNCYEIKMDNRLCSAQIQITYRPNIAALFKSVDIPCTSICYFGGKILMDEKAKFALDSCVIEVDPTIKHHKYGARLEKYFNKGYDILLRDLDLNKLDKRNLDFGESEVLDLPNLNIFYSKISKNKISVDSIQQTGHTNCVKGMMTSLTVGAMIHKNIRNLVNGRFDEFVTFGQGEKFKFVFARDVVITDRMITNCYQKIKTAVSTKTLNLGKIQQYYTCRPIETILKELLVDFASKECSYTSKGYLDHVKEYFEELTNEQIEFAKKKNRERRGTGSLDIVTSVEEEEEKGSTCAFMDFYGQYSNCSCCVCSSS